MENIFFEDFSMNIKAKGKLRNSGITRHKNGWQDTKMDNHCKKTNAMKEEFISCLYELSVKATAICDVSIHTTNALLMKL